MYTIKTRKLGFMVKCSVYGSRDWVIGLCKDGVLVRVKQDKDKFYYCQLAADQ